MSTASHLPPLLKSPVSTNVCITTTEMHTAGEPVRIIESGYPVPQGATILEKIGDLLKNYDAYRKFVILEPRGHFDMYAVLLVTPDEPDVDIGAIFLHNEGYATMCGHVCIALGRYAIDRGLIRRPISYPETEVRIQTPCGKIQAFVAVEQGQTVETGRTRFESVPNFVVALDVELQVPGYGKVVADVMYGGAFYALVVDKDVGLDIKTASVQEVRKAADAIKAVAKDAVQLSHPSVPAFLYGIILVDTRDSMPAEVSRHICIFADSETDRSPCGSGTSARVTLMYFRGHLKLGQHQRFQSGVTGAEFIGSPVREVDYDNKKALIASVEGHAYYTGRSTLTLEKGDTLGRGFLVR